MADGGSHIPEDLAAAVHETTNTLTVILGWIARAREASQGQAEALVALDRAARYAQTARRVMRRAIGAEVAEIQPERTGELVRRTAEDLATEAKRAGVRIETKVQPAAAEHAIPHPELVWQILTNLVLNAIAVSPSGGSIVIRVYDTSQGAVAFHVIDEGPGIPTDMRDTLFTGVSKRKGGAGIGLRHCRGLAKQHGGELRVLDIPGMKGSSGAVFELIWPIADPATLPAPPSDRPAAPSGKTGLDGARVLLLEDDAAVVELLELSLGARGAAVTTVSSAGALHREVASGRYDVMLVDLSPLSAGRPHSGVSENAGLDRAIATARRANPEIDVVVISGSVVVQPRPDIVWVRKPFEPRELVDAIARQLRRNT